MFALSDELCDRCRRIFSKCDEFDTDAALSAVFVTAALYPFRDRLPGADKKSTRIDAFIRFLVDNNHSDGRPLLILVLEALRDKYARGNALRDELDQLRADVLQYVLAQPSPVPPGHNSLSVSLPPSSPVSSSDFKAEDAEEKTRASVREPILVVPPDLAPTPTLPHIPFIAKVMLAMLLLDSVFSLVLMWRFIGGRPDLLSYIEAVTGLIGVLLQIVFFVVAIRVREMSWHQILTELATRRWLQLGITLMTVLLLGLLLRNFIGPHPAMIRVPAGKFQMGGNSINADEIPTREVYIDTFWIDRTEVTNAQYKRCVEAGICALPHKLTSSTRESYYDNPAFDDYPVIYVNWEQAAVYCEWAGARLPTEAEWEYAARGSQGNVFPWGNEFDGTRLNYCDRDCDSSKVGVDWADKAVDDGYADTAPVGNYPKGRSWCGALDMSGNVWEWVADWYIEDYPVDQLSVNPQGPSSGMSRIIRGGAWDFDKTHARTTVRLAFHPTNADDGVGFRCARSDREPVIKSTPVAVPTLTPTPVTTTLDLSPSATILLPSDNDAVSVRTEINGHAVNIPNDQVLWLLVHTIGASYYPQPGPIKVDIGGNWVVSADIGSASELESGRPYTLTVVSVNVQSSQEFSSFLASWPENRPVGLTLPEDATILDTVKVIRTNPIVTLTSHQYQAYVGNSETLRGTYRHMKPGDWLLYGIVELGDDHFIPYGPFEPQTDNGEWAIDVLFPWPADGSRNVFFHTLTVLTRTYADEILRSSGGKPLSRMDLRPVDWDVILGPTTQVKLTRSERIAFTSDKQGNDDIFIINTDGTGLLRLTDDPADDMDPAWSPDGTSVIFASRRYGPVQLLVVDSDGRNVRRLIQDSNIPGRAPSWSPDGEWVTFHSEPGGSINSYDIYKVRVDGTGLTQLTDTADRDLFPVWSPDGKSILFFSELAEDDADRSELYMMDTDGITLTRITHNTFEEGNAVWSPDGQSILFVRDTGDQRDIYLMNTDGSNAQRVAGIDYDRHPSFASDGQRFVFDSSVSNRQIFITTLGSGRPQQLETGLAKSWGASWSPVQGDNQIVFEGRFNGDWEIYTMWDDGTDRLELMDNNSNEVQPRISTDGKRVVFASNIAGNYDIWLEDARTPSEWTRLTNDPADDLYPAWSPDNKQIAFASNRDGDWDIYVMNDEGKGGTQLTNDPAKDSYPVWSTDGKRIIFYSERNGDGDIYIMDKDGNHVTPLMINLGFDWSPALSPDGQKLLFASARDHGGTYATEIYMFDFFSQVLTRLTNNDSYDGNPIWSGDGQRIFFTSDRNYGIDDIWVMDVDGSNARNLTDDDRSDVFEGP